MSSANLPGYLGYGESIGPREVHLVETPYSRQ